MFLANLPARRRGPAGRLPERIEERRGAARGVVRLPGHLTWPGTREFDLADRQVRCSLYGILLTQGRRDDMARFLNAGLLRQDWPELRGRLDRGCAAGASGASRWRLKARRGETGRGPRVRLGSCGNT